MHEKNIREKLIANCYTVSMTPKNPEKPKNFPIPP